MRAAKYIAEERGLYDTDSEPQRGDVEATITIQEKAHIPTMSAPLSTQLIERLSVDSLLEVARFLGCSVSELIARYAATKDT